MASNSIVIRQPEKPIHYNYLKSFRVEQCNDFVNFQCPKHKPFNCFKWHFPNQRRRRPVFNSREGKFNYSSEVYCAKYDEFNGTCPDKDACPLMHKTVGDTEHLYHLRYYKVELCSGNLNAQGHCEKNGSHCAFAHGASDLRQPVTEKQEQTKNKTNEVKTGAHTKTGTQSSEASDKLLREDNSALQESHWNDASYLMNNFKVQECPNHSSTSHSAHPCPRYHSHKDRRRCLSRFKYSSVACPLVKGNDEWGDPDDCDHGDMCNYSHNANETCYHPDVFRSKACTREQTYGHCIRGTFCPFSHSKVQPPISTTSINSSSSTGFQNINTIIPSSSSSSSSFSSASYKTPVTRGTSSSISNLTKDDKKEEHFYDVLDAISDYNISDSSTNNNLPNSNNLPNNNNNLPNNNNNLPNNNNNIYNNNDLSNIPFTNDIVYINPNLSSNLLQESNQMMSIESRQQDRLMEVTHDLGLLNVGLYEGEDKRRTHPPGFEKKMMAENKELLKLREDRNDLERRLAQETMLKEKAVKERDKALSLLETFKMQPSLDDQHLMYYLTETSRFDNLTLASLFKLHSKLNQDVTLLNNAMEEALSSGEQRCSKCRMSAGRMELSCGHSCYCYACYISEVACPQCAQPFFTS